MVNLDALKSLQTNAVSLASSLGLVYSPLNDTELGTFGTSFERSFVAENVQRDIVDIHMRHQTESLVGAMVAKAQMNSSIDGEQPSSNQVGGPLLIKAAYLGIGNSGLTSGDWDLSVTTTFAEVNWIDSAGLLGGTAGNAIRVGQNSLFVIYGVGTFSQSPVIEDVRFVIDAKPKSAMYVGSLWRSSNLKVKEFDTAYLLKQNTTFLAKYLATQAGTDSPYLIGVAYIPEPYLRTSSFGSQINTTTNQNANNLIFPT